MTTLQKIEKDFNNLSFNDIETVLTHFDKKHLNISDVDEMKRLVDKNKTAQSHFDFDDLYEEDDYFEKMSDEQIAKVVIEETILASKKDILNWLKISENGEKQSFICNYGLHIGTGFKRDDNKLIREYKTSDINICLKRDISAKYGFTLVTAYPELNNPKSKLIETNRDLTCLVCKTDKYKHASIIEKAALAHAANPNNKMTPLVKTDPVTGKHSLVLRLKTPRVDGVPDIFYRITIPESNDSLLLKAKQYLYIGHGTKTRDIETDFTREAKANGACRNSSVDLKTSYASYRFKQLWPQEFNEMYRASDTIELVKNNELELSKKADNPEQE